MSSKPWTSGPKELLEHAKKHLQERTAFDFRIAMISIDNAVELAIKTYLALPKRIRGTEGPPRRELETAQGFPDLLDLLEKYAEDKLSGIELGDIEWYHRLRNTLYHDGNGVTVDPEKVDAYNQVANLLFQNLFGDPGKAGHAPEPETLLGEFVLKWASLEFQVRRLAAKHLPKRAAGVGVDPVGSLYDGLIAKGVVPSNLRGRLEELIRARSHVIHNPAPVPAEQLTRLVAEVEALSQALPSDR